jgi:hypothetical protein
VRELQFAGGREHDVNADDATDAHDESVTRVTVGEREYPLDPATPFLFGRMEVEGIVGLDPLDTGISRLAGRIVHQGGWMVANESSSRPLMVEFPTVVRRQQIAPGGDSRLNGPALILVPGASLTHALHVQIPREEAGARTPLPGALQSTKVDMLSDADHLALAAIGEGYLQRWPRHDPNPCSYDEAAAKLGVSPTALRRRVERLRENLGRRGNFIAAGPHALRELVEYYIDTGRLRVGDVDFLTKARAASAAGAEAAPGAEE